jgi:hypothetical protein
VNHWREEFDPFVTAEETRELQAASPLLLVEFAAQSTYPMRSRGRAAARALRQLAGDPAPEQVADFVRSFGPLLYYSQWVSAAVNAGVPGDELGRPGDCVLFQDWARHHAPGVDRYLHLTWLTEEHEVRRLPEPVALYPWAAEYLLRLEAEGRRGHLSQEVEVWLSARLGEMRLSIPNRSSDRVTRGWFDLLSTGDAASASHAQASRRDGVRVTIEASTLIAYLAVSTLLDTTGSSAEYRACGWCGEVFEVTDARQRFCTPQHADSHRKRRKRRMSRGEAAAETTGEA